jgi:hypothetical protein
MKIGHRSAVLAVSLWMMAGSVTAVADSQRELTLASTRVTAPPVIDGNGDDAVWRGAATLSFDAVGVWGPSLGTSANVTVQSVYTDTHIAFLVRWNDATRDDEMHKPWVWNPSNKAYEQGMQQEDAMALAFEHTGPFLIDMLSHVDAVWDLWTWKATRSDPVGYALDKTHRYSTTKPNGKAKEYPSRTGAPVWIQRPNDAGESTQKPRPAPTKYEGNVVPQYAIQQPNGSAADVRAKGHWANGRWTVELLRKLDTGHADDTVFNPTRAYAMAVAVQDRTGDMDKASPPMRLRFDVR